jgi:hypothetical protein
MAIIWANPALATAKTQTAKPVQAITPAPRGLDLAPPRKGQAADPQRAKAPAYHGRLSATVADAIARATPHEKRAALAALKAEQAVERRATAARAAERRKAAEIAAFEKECRAKLAAIAERKTQEAAKIKAGWAKAAAHVAYRSGLASTPPAPDNDPHGWGAIHDGIAGRRRAQDAAVVLKILR